MISSKFNILNAIRKKISDIARQYNTISPSVIYQKSTYISGSILSGEIYIGEHTKINQCYIEGNIRIGRYTTLWGPGIFLSGKINGISIGNFCSIARNVSIQEDYHNPLRTTTYFIEKNLINPSKIKNESISKGRVEIGNDVWVGANSVILSGVKVGTGSIIGAGSVVTKDVPAYSICAGNPAAIIKPRFTQATIDIILSSNWWEWPTEKIINNADFLTFIHNK